MELETMVYDKAREVALVVPELKEIAEGLRPEHVLVDLPLNKVVARGGDILTRTQEGHVGTPNLFFDPEKWSQAYEHQKQCGFVFAPREAIPLISLAARIVFYDRFQIAMTTSAEHAAKCMGVVRTEWIDQTAAAGACSAECLAALREERPRLVPIREEDVLLPDEWRTADPTLARRLAEGFQDAVPAGFPASVHNAIRDAIPSLASFLDMTEQGGTFIGLDKLSERELQSRLRDHLRSRSIRIVEGSEVGGGETDLLLPGELVIENKVAGEVAKPLDYGPNYCWQGRRYSIAVCRKVVFVVLGYRPANEEAILPLTSRLVVEPIGSGPDALAQVRIVVPWGHSVPSRVKAP
ncbi:hypothetical protein V5E97_05925 [Singulisphaera sp. Ch08]|uniref:Restriction endonuclease n=1 Tax=Singulisphaera sp. Ch08 TaxID=3120278 RepID=A0AAU7CK03_9BACT